MRIAPNIFSNQFTLLQNKHSCASSGENSKRWISGDTYVSGRRIVWRRRRETCDTDGRIIFRRWSEHSPPPGVCLSRQLVLLEASSREEAEISGAAETEIVRVWSHVSLLAAYITNFPSSKHLKKSKNPMYL